MADMMLGEIRSFAFGFAPRGWLPCNGQVLPIAVYSALFSLLGTQYGGNGQTTFALPDLRGRVLVGRGQMPGGDMYVQSGYYGVEDVKLSVDQIPSHRHGWTAATGTANVAPAANNLLAEPTFSEQTMPLYAVPAEGDTFVRLAGESIADAGAGRPHGNLQPYLATGYYMAIQGFFPHRG